jgi:hypothetical protein
MTSRGTASFWLAVPPKAAYGGKPEHWYVEDLPAQGALYEGEPAARGVVHFDGTCPAKELTGQIALGGWEVGTR